jgi:hypothetical protein
LEPWYSEGCEPAFELGALSFVHLASRTVARASSLHCRTSTDEKVNGPTTSFVDIDVSNHPLVLAGLPVVVVSRRQVRHFARAAGQLAQTDTLDGRVLVLFTERMKPEAQPILLSRPFTPRTHVRPPLLTECRSPVKSGNAKSSLRDMRRYSLCGVWTKHACRDNGFYSRFGVRKAIHYRSA